MQHLNLFAFTLFHILVIKSKAYVPSYLFSRRDAFSKALPLGFVVVIGEPANAESEKSRTDGYKVQHSNREWEDLLSSVQFDVLRQGGTERPNTSILTKEYRSGIYTCAGCGTKLFASDMKFNSGTGWPSFADALPGVEVEQVSAFQMNLFGAEVRCIDCGGHLGDLFLDGDVYSNTPAFKTGKRYCIDGAAMVFYPSDGSPAISGDVSRFMEKSMS